MAAIAIRERLVSWECLESELPLCMSLYKYIKLCIQSSYMYICYPCKHIRNGWFTKGLFVILQSCFRLKHRDYIRYPVQGRNNITTHHHCSIYNIMHNVHSVHFKSISRDEVQHAEITHTPGNTITLKLDVIDT